MAARWVRAVVAFVTSRPDVSMVTYRHDPDLVPIRVATKLDASARVVEVVDVFELEQAGVSQHVTGAHSLTWRSSGIGEVVIAALSGLTSTKVYDVTLRVTG